MRFNTLFCLLLLTAGCSDQLFVPVSYSPANPKATIGAVETQELSVFMEHIERKGSHFIYDLEVVNNSDHAIMLDPRDIFFYGGEQAFSPVRNGEDVHAVFSEAAPDARGVFALNEKQVNRDIRANIKAKETVAFVLFLAATAVVVNDVVKDSKDFSKDFWSRSDQRRSNVRDVATFAGLITIDMVREGVKMEQMKQFEDLEYLPDEYFHKTLVLPGESIRGKVFFPRKDVQHIRMVVEIESRDYIFDFRQATGNEKRLIRN